ncbi:MAG: hypothetical protein V7746_01025, partial [Halioglobus sp.]
MTRLIFALAFALGVAAIVWTASIFIGSNNLALAVTAMIAVAFALGFYELANFRGATASLLTALDQLPGSEDGDLDRWIGALHPSLQNAVRQRIEGERLGLPAPFITPYLVGLLVMLGLLGTFVGMVDTLQGAVFALEGTTELQAIRAGLAAPINGLSLAFGTSVAGVAASAMLGLASTLSRRERMLATRELDSRAAKELPELSLSHNRKETYRVMQMQAQALPEVAQRLERLADSLETMGDRLGEKLLENQNQFHDSVDARYSALATSVDSSLQESLSSSARAAADSIRPIIA